MGFRGSYKDVLDILKIILEYKNVIFIKILQILVGYKYSLLQN